MYVAEEGAVEPRAAALSLLSAAERQGARFIAGTAVRGLIVRGDRVEGALTDGGEMHADEVLLAAGAASPDIAATAGVTLPLTTPPGLLVSSRRHERLLNGLVMAPDLHMRQTDEGRIVAGADFGGSDPRTDAAATARAVFAKLQSMLSGGEQLVMKGHSTGYRPTPVDGFPVIGRPNGRRSSLYRGHAFRNHPGACCRPVRGGRTAARPARSAAGALWAVAVHSVKARDHGA